MSDKIISQASHPRVTQAVEWLKTLLEGKASVYAVNRSHNLGGGCYDTIYFAVIIISIGKPIYGPNMTVEIPLAETSWETRLLMAGSPPTTNNQQPTTNNE